MHEQTAQWALYNPNTSVADDAQFEIWRRTTVTEVNRKLDTYSSAGSVVRRRGLCVLGIGGRYGVYFVGWWRPGRWSGVTGTVSSARTDSGVTGGCCCCRLGNDSSERRLGSGAQCWQSRGGCWRQDRLLEHVSDAYLEQQPTSTFSQQQKNPKNFKTWNIDNDVCYL